jgi:hypothetical protein
MSKSKSNAYERLINGLVAYPSGDVKPPRKWPHSKTHRISCASRRPNESEWLRRLALS